MTEYIAKRNADRCPGHPGAQIEDIIPATGKTKVEVAALLGISRQRLYDIIRESKPVSPQIASRLGQAGHLQKPAPDRRSWPKDPSIAHRCRKKPGSLAP